MRNSRSVLSATCISCIAIFALTCLQWHEACRVSVGQEATGTAASQIAGLASCTTQPNENLNAVLWVQLAAEYRANALQSYNIARRQLAAAIADENWSALVEMPSGPFPEATAVILDLDETVLDNSAHQAYLTRNQLSYSPTIWSQWVKSEAAGAVPGVIEFVKAAVEGHVQVFFVTNRSANDKSATIANLQKLGFPAESDGTNVLCADEKDPDTGNKWTSDKTARRVLIGKKYRVLLLLGDQLGDFIADSPDLTLRSTTAGKYADMWGDKWLIVPNPMYGNYEQLLSGNSGSRAVAIDRKNQALRIWLPPQ